MPHETRACRSRSTHFARRNAPSLLYLRHIPRLGFRLEDDDAPAPAPFGGYFRDGRADSIARLVGQPLLNPDEMNNSGARGLSSKLQHASYAAVFRRECGPVFADTRGSVNVSSIPSNRREGGLARAERAGN